MWIIPVMWSLKLHQRRIIELELSQRAKRVEREIRSRSAFHSHWKISGQLAESDPGSWLVSSRCDLCHCRPCTSFYRRHWNALMAISYRWKREAVENWPINSIRKKRTLTSAPYIIEDNWIAQFASSDDYIMYKSLQSVGRMQMSLHAINYCQAW